jgi:hypothetical protein
MEAREYVESVASELLRLRGRGLVLSSDDAQLALGWHAAGVPLSEVLASIRRVAASQPKGANRKVRGAAPALLTLRTLAPTIDAGLRRRVAAEARATTGRTSLCDELRCAAATPGLSSRERWRQLADRSEELLARSSEAYWSEVIGALLSSLRALPRSARLQAGAGLRSRAIRRRGALEPARFRRTLQMQLVRSSSEALGLPPAPFLL